MKSPLRRWTGGRGAPVFFFFFFGGGEGVGEHIDDPISRREVMILRSRASDTPTLSERVRSY